MEKHSTGPEKLDPSHSPQSTTLFDNGQTEGSMLDKDAEKRLLRKLDLRIIPILWLIFMLAFLDRTNVRIYNKSSVTSNLLKNEHRLATLKSKA
jgi:hypothetical protein